MANTRACSPTHCGTSYCNALQHMLLLWILSHQTTNDGKRILVKWKHATDDAIRARTHSNENEIIFQYAREYTFVFDKGK